MPQVTAAQELQIKAQMRLASLMEEKLVTRISVLSTLLGGGKITERLFVRASSAKVLMRIRLVRGLGVDRAEHIRASLNRRENRERYPPYAEFPP